MLDLIGRHIMPGSKTKEGLLINARLSTLGFVKCIVYSGVLYIYIICSFKDLAVHVD